MAQTTSTPQAGRTPCEDISAGERSSTSAESRIGAYRVSKLHGFDRLVTKAETALGDRLGEVEALLDLDLPMDTTQAEIFATVYAGWNNLLIDGKTPTDEDIGLRVTGELASEKLKIPRERFFKAIQFLREKRFRVSRRKSKRGQCRPRVEEVAADQAFSGNSPGRPW